MPIPTHLSGHVRYQTNLSRNGWYYMHYNWLNTSLKLRTSIMVRRRNCCLKELIFDSAFKMAAESGMLMVGGLDAGIIIVNIFAETRKVHVGNVLGYNYTESLH